MKRVLWALVGGLLAAPAWAQSPYVAGAIGAEIVRSTSVESSGSTFDTGNGESWSGALRVGALVTPRVGVELEFLRAAAIENSGNGPIYIAADLPRTVVGSLVPDAAIFPIIAAALRRGDLAAVFCREEAVRSEQRSYAGRRNFLTLIIRP